MPRQLHAFYYISFFFFLFIHLEKHVYLCMFRVLFLVNCNNQMSFIEQMHMFWGHFVQMCCALLH